MEETNKYLSQIDPRFLQGGKEKSAPKASTPPTAEELKDNKYLAQINPDFFKPKEGIAKGIARTGAQLPLGYAQKYTWPADLVALIAKGEALGEFDELEERLPELMKKFPQAPWENFKGLDKEKYMQAVESASQTAPTQSGLETLIEHATGLPLRPKNEAQKLLRLGSTAATFKPGTATQKATAGVVAPTVKSIASATGLPEGVADVIGLTAGAGVPTPSVSKITKPSGMTTRGFESLKKDTKVSPARSEAIKESVEGDFRKIADKILEKNRTYSVMKNDNMFKEKVSGLFDKVEDLAANVKGDVHSQDIRDAFRKRYNSRETKGISPDEFERAFRKEVRGIQKSIPHEELNASQLVEQYRKNNASLRELFEPGKSSAFNRAKKESLLEYNRAIEDVITKEFPDTEFKDLFSFTNKRWQEINDVEQMNHFIDEVTKGEINYGKAKELFRRDKQNVARPFKRALGDEGFEQFKTLTEDLLSTEKYMKYVKSAKEAGFDELAKNAALYLTVPKIGVTRTLSKGAKSLYQMVLDKPKLLITWKSALGDLKSGNYKEAEKAFKELAKATSTLQTNPTEPQ